MAQEIQLTIVRIQLLNASTPHDIAAQVAPTLTSLEGTMEHFHVNAMITLNRCVMHAWQQLLLKTMKMVHEQSKKSHWTLDFSLGHKHLQEL